MEGSNGDFGRRNGHDNNQRTQPITSTGGSQPVRQDDEWSVPPAVERRDDVGRQQVTQTSPQPSLLLQRKDYLPIEVVKILQEKELVSNSNQLGV